MPSLLRRKSTMRYWRLWPPPRWRIGDVAEVVAARSALLRFGERARPAGPCAGRVDDLDHRAAAGRGRLHFDDRHLLGLREVDFLARLAGSRRPCASLRRRPMTLAEALLLARDVDHVDRVHVDLEQGLDRRLALRPWWRPGARGTRTGCSSRRSCALLRHDRSEQRPASARLGWIRRCGAGFIPASPRLATARPGSSAPCRSAPATADRHAAPPAPARWAGCATASSRFSSAIRR